MKVIMQPVTRCHKVTSYPLTSQLGPFKKEFGKVMDNLLHYKYDIVFFTIEI